MQEKIRVDAVEDKRGLKRGFRIEVDRVGAGLSVLVYGVTSVREFSESTALLRSGKSAVRINGSALNVAVYEGLAVEIIGKVSGVEFL